ncbi:MAG: MFS transporter [Deltaproteobacteria bacterium]
MMRRFDPILVACWFCAFTPILDTNIVNLAIPRIGMAFETTASELAWVVTAYVIPFAVTILAIGRLGDRFGRRRLLTIGSLLFAASSLACALAPSYGALIAARAIQGIGGSTLITTGLGIISASYSGPARARALGIFFSGGFFAGVVGPMLGGILTTLFTWRGMFAVQVPLALLAVVLARQFLRDQERRTRSLDLPGLAIGTVMLLGINIGLLQAHSWGWLSAPIIGAWVIAVLALFAFIGHERASTEPAVDLRVFGNRSFVAHSLAGAAMWWALVSLGIELSLYLQGGRDLDPTQAAIALTPWPLLGFFTVPRVGIAISRIGHRATMLLGLGVCALCGLALVLLPPDAPIVAIALLEVPMGVAMSLVLVTSAAGAVAEFAPQDAGIAAAIFNSVRQIGTSLGVAIPAAVYDAVTGGSLIGASVVDGTRWAFAVTAIMLISTAIAVTTLTRERAHVSVPGLLDG